ncbi:Nicotianamine synthase [Basidiobolus meristosporus CBS 931.73]|uniref:Nicotianamine synthase n=1 Tax=Basidiobolus meristosporus CBS 931.73 TaxID=1314790 RepID=A0A1Y1Z785_9FUNG|nr:Nicotianamine synthase [Basidiobolus meristosporus CBS 931.73]|eukprot:ORY05974.1 Nicotianamine synthase [Basidiobolus meristosporus CBS 931.73]
MLSRTSIPSESTDFLQQNGCLETTNIRDRICSIYQVLTKAAVLDPCPEINDAFSELVSICIKTLPRHELEIVLHDRRITEITQHFRQLCALGEFRLEVKWASQIVASPKDTTMELLRFPYYQNYVALVKMELNAIRSVLMKSPERIAFLGSGPLPLTSICLARELLSQEGNSNPANFAIDNYDIDAEALELSMALVNQLADVQDNMQFHHQGVEDIQDLKKHDVVYLAALVGLEPAEKQKITKQLWKAMKTGSYLILRSAHSLRTLLYPEIETEMLTGFEPVLVVHPYNEVVNSIIIARRLQVID